MGDSQKNHYIEEVQIRKEIKKSFIAGTPTEELKNIFFLIIDNLLTSPNFNGYDEEIKDTMRISAFEFLSSYWKGFSEKRIVLKIYKDRETVKKQLPFINPKRIVDKKEFTQIGIPLKNVRGELNEVLKICEKKNWKYESKEISSDAFSYLTQIAKSAFLQTIKKFKQKYRMYTVQKDTNNGLSIVSNEESDKKIYMQNENSEYYRNLNPLNYDSEIDDYEFLKKSFFEKIRQKNGSNKGNKYESNGISVEIIEDSHPVLQIILEVCKTVDELFFLVSLAYDEKLIGKADIINNTVVLYLLNKAR